MREARLPLRSSWRSLTALSAEGDALRSSTVSLTILPVGVTVKNYFRTGRTVLRSPREKLAGRARRAHEGGLCVGRACRACCPMLLDVDLVTIGSESTVIALLSTLGTPARCRCQYEIYAWDLQRSLEDTADGLESAEFIFRW